MSNTAKEYTTAGLLDGINKRLETLYMEYNEERLIHQPDYKVERLRFMESKYVKDHDRVVRNIKKFIKNYLSKLHTKVSNREIIDFMRWTDLCSCENYLITYHTPYGKVVFLNCDDYVTFRSIDPDTTPVIVKLFIPKVDQNTVKLAMLGNRI